MPWAHRWGRACWSADMHMHTHTHTRNRHPHCHIAMKMPWGKVGIGALSFTYTLEGQDTEASASFQTPRSYLHTCCTAVTQLHAPNLAFSQRWHMYQAEEEMSWVGKEWISDRCHPQSAQACLRCVNYSINQHIALTGYQYLITYDTLAVNRLKNVQVCEWRMGHISCYCSSHSEPSCHSQCVAFWLWVCEKAK